MSVHQSCVAVVLKHLGLFQDFEAYVDDKTACHGGQVLSLTFDIAELLKITILEAEGLILEMVSDGIFTLTRLGGSPFYAEFTPSGHEAWEAADV